MADVAVVVTSYGLGRTLGEALDSVRGQTLPPRELLVVDDGSTDALTLEALARAEADGVRVARTPNRGVSAARNLGARLTAAPYLAFLDGDDLLAPTYLAAAAARLDADPGLGFVTSGLRGFGATEYEWTPPPLTLDALLHHQPPHISSLLRRGTFAAAGGFDEGLRCYEDLDLWISFLSRDVRGEVLPEPLLAYRTRGDSLLRGALRRPVHVAAMERIYDRHWPWLSRQGEAMLVAKQGFLLALNQHRRHLHHLREEAERELAALRAEAASLGEELARHDIAAVDWGDLRRPQPLTPTWGEERGRPVDRAVIEAFLDRHREEVRGRVLEVKDPGYSRAFGGDRVTHQDVLDVDPGNPQATIIGDLGSPEGGDGRGLPAEAYDCIILTQTLGYVLEPRCALANLHRALKPGGVLLFSVGGQTRIEHEGRGRDGDYWRFTEASLRALFAGCFPPGSFALEGHGNVTLATAFLHGIAAEELDSTDFEHVDAHFPVVYCVRAVKPPASVARGAILAYHRIGDAATDPLGLTTSPEDFRAHLEMLRRELRPMALAELVEAARLGAVPAGALAVTFDDGYHSTLVHAVPALLEWGIPAAHFVLTAGLDEPGEPWWETLGRLVFDDGPTPPTLTVTLEGESREIPTANADERRAAHEALRDALVRGGLEERAAVLDAVARWRGGALPPWRESHRMLLAAEVQQLDGIPGQRIACHGGVHTFLPAQPAAVQHAELAAAKRRLERLLGHAVDAFAYPHGGYDDEVVELVAASGFTSAVTVDAGGVAPGADPLRLPRLLADGLSVDELRRRLHDAGVFAAAAPHATSGAGR